MYKGLKHADGSPIEVDILDSDIHVFTRLSLRDNPSQKQIDNQQNALVDMANRMK